MNASLPCQLPRNLWYVLYYIIMCTAICIPSQCQVLFENLHLITTFCLQLVSGTLGLPWFEVCETHTLYRIRNKMLCWQDWLLKPHKQLCGWLYRIKVAKTIVHTYMGTSLDSVTECVEPSTHLFLVPSIFATAQSNLCHHMQPVGEGSELVNWLQQLGLLHYKKPRAPTYT